MKKLTLPTKKMLLAAEVAEWLGMSLRTARRRTRAWRLSRRLPAQRGPKRAWLYRAADVRRCYLEDQGLVLKPHVVLDERALQLMRATIPSLRHEPLRALSRSVLLEAVHELASTLDHALYVAEAYEELVDELSLITDRHQHGELSQNNAWQQFAARIERIHQKTANYDEDDPRYALTEVLRYARRIELLGEAEEGQGGAGTVPR